MSSQKEFQSMIPQRPDPIPRTQGEEYIVESILKHRRRGRGYQFLTLMKGSPTHDAEWQPTRDFVDKDGTINDKFYKYIKCQGILQELWADQDKKVVEVDNSGGGE